MYIYIFCIYSIYILLRWQLQFYKKTNSIINQTNPDRQFFDKREINCKLATHCYSILQSQHNILFLICYYWYVESFSSIDLSQEPTHVPPACQRQVIIPFYQEHTDKLIQAHSERWPVRSCLSRRWSSHQSHSVTAALSCAWISRSEEPSWVWSLFVVCHSVSDTGKISLLSTCHGFQTEGLYSVSVNNVSNMSEWVYVVFVTHYTKSTFPVSRDTISAHSYCLLINQFE